SLEACEEIVVEKEDFVHSITTMKAHQFIDNPFGRKAGPLALINERVGAEGAFVGTASGRAVIDLSPTFVTEVALNIEKLVPRGWKLVHPGERPHSRALGYAIGFDTQSRNTGPAVTVVNGVQEFAERGLTLGDYNGIDRSALDALLGKNRRMPSTPDDR